MKNNKYEIWWNKHHEKGKVKYIQRGIVIGILAGLLTAILNTFLFGYPISITLSVYILIMLIIGIFGSLLSWNYYENKYYGEKY